MKDHERFTVADMVVIDGVWVRNPMTGLEIVGALQYFAISEIDGESVTLYPYRVAHISEITRVDADFYQKRRDARTP